MMSRQVATCRDIMLLAKLIKRLELLQSMVHRALASEPFLTLGGGDLLAFDVALAAGTLQRSLGNRAAASVNGGVNSGHRAAQKSAT